MSSEIAIAVANVAKSYAIFEEPTDRLKQMIVPRIRRAMGLPVNTYYREYWALRDVSFEVRRGETTGILGRNGAGKSTLLQIVSGIMQPTAGTVSIHGRVSALLELGTGFNPEFSGRQNVMLSGQLKGVSESEMLRRFDEIADFADIGDFIDYPVKTYSSGMLVRLAFAVHAVLDPDILIIDEALAVGDVRFQSKCYDWLAQLKARGTSILFVTHDVGAVRRFCEHAIWLEGGRCAASGNVYDVTSAYTEFMMVGPDVERPNRIQQQNPEKTEARVALTPHQDGASPEAFASRYPYVPERHKPLRRWGSHVGAIRAVEVTGSDAEPSAEFEVGAEIEVHIVTDLPPDIPRDGLSVGMGIRSVDGNDLVIRSTYDDPQWRTLSGTSLIHVVFRITNILANGEYRLAVTLENRASVVPSYYDFIEGALYFKSSSQRYRWGLVVPDIAISVTPAGQPAPR